jgi:hypothetical protein
MPRQTHRMPRQKCGRDDSDDDADELLLKALRQLADEALEEEIPERLLRLVRTAERRHEGEGDGPEGRLQESAEKSGKRS